MNKHTMIRRNFMALMVLASLTGSCSSSFKAPAKTRKPNIILCMVDDMGKEGVGCYHDSKPSPTPNLDRMAAKGMKFNNFYVMPQCTPTRVALLTGQYPFRNGWVNHYDVPRWDLKGFNPKTNPCMGNVMKSAGYQTCIAGKWQISDFRREPEILNDCGFDDYCMWTGGESKNPKSDRRYWDAYIHTKEGSKTYKGQFGPDVFTASITDFIELHKSDPMFIYYPMVLQHDPLEKQPDDSTPHQYIDRLVGRIQTAVEKAGIADNTIFVFFTDNGRIGKSKTVESGICVPLIVYGPGLIPEGVETDALVDVTDFLPTLADLAGTKLPAQYVYDGRSFADLLTGKAADSSREWIMAMGGAPCNFPREGVPPFEAKNVKRYRNRVLRDKSYKVFVNTEGQIEKLTDVKSDPQEKRNINIIDSEKPAVKAALQKFSNVISTFPSKDNNPQY